MMHLRGLVLFLFLLPADARRSNRIDDSRDYAQQQDNMLANRLEVSAGAREAFVPGVFRPPVFHRAGPQAGALREGSKQDGRRVVNADPSMQAASATAVEADARAPTRVLQDRRSVLSAAAAAAIFSTAGPARAVEAAPSFQGVFKDPMNPNGYRVLVGDTGNTGEGYNTMTLQDEPDGKVYSIPITSETDKKTGQVTLTMNLSSVYPARPSAQDVVATLNKDGSILFPDGNLWKKQGGVNGVYSDGFNPDRLRIIREEKREDAQRRRSGVLVVDLLGGPNGPERVPGRVVAPDVMYFDIPGKPGDKGVFNQGKGTISFGDGNVWTKL